MTKEFFFNFLKNNKIILYISTLLILFLIKNIKTIDVANNSTKNNVLNENLFRQNYKKVVLKDYCKIIILKMLKKDINNKFIEDIKNVISNLNDNVNFNKINFILMIVKKNIISLVIFLIIALLNIRFKFKCNYNLNKIMILKNTIILCCFVSIFKLGLNSMMFIIILSTFYYCSNNKLLFNKIKNDINFNGEYSPIFIAS